MTPRKEGKRKFPCPYPGCESSCSKSNDVVRHLKEQHQPPKKCPRPGCLVDAVRIHRLEDHVKSQHHISLSRGEIPVPRFRTFYINSTNSLDFLLDEIDTLIAAQELLYQETLREIGTLNQKITHFHQTLNDSSPQRSVRLTGRRRSCPYTLNPTTRLIDGSSRLVPMHHVI
jgi:hypothetical protein